MPAQGVKIATADLMPFRGIFLDAIPTDVTPDLWYHPYVVAGIAKALMGEDSFYPLFTESTFQGDSPMTRTEAALLLANLLVISAP